MPLIPLKCPSCGGAIEVDSDKDAAICQFCGNPYIVKDAIVKNYITNVTNITAQNVTIVNSEADFDIFVGKLRGYSGASTSIEIPSTVKIIGAKAFKGLPLVSVIIPEGVEKIEDEAFMECKKIEEITIPSSVKSIGDNAFKGCVSLKEITVENPNAECGTGVLLSCSSLKTVNASDQVKKIIKPWWMS